MFQRLVSLSLIALLLHTAYAMPARARNYADEETSPVERVKTQVAKRGVGKKVTVKLRNGTKLKGHITKIGADNFDLTDSKSGQVTTLAYTDVAQVKDQGGLSMIAKVGIVLGIVVGALALLYGIGCGNDPYC